MKIIREQIHIGNGFQICRLAINIVRWSDSVLNVHSLIVISTRFINRGCNHSRGGGSASGRRDVGSKWEREAGGEVKSIWDVGS